MTLINVDTDVLEARPATYGNGIELVDKTSGSGTLTVTRSTLSTAAIGLGLIPEGQESSTANSPGTLTAADVNPLECEGIFTALLRLQTALQTGDTLGAQRAIGLLDESVVAMSFSRAELAARQQGLDTVQLRLDSEDVDLRATLSEDFDADLVEVISDLTARQIALEASLRSTASIFQMTLLDYL